MRLPKMYQILNKENAFEIRQYNNLPLAKVIVTGPFESAYLTGGSLLMNYLKGNNYKKISIAHRSLFMMVPRVEGWEVSCILPEDFTLKSLPRPIGDNIQFEELHSRKVAVHRFRGKSAYATMMRRSEELKNWAHQTHLTLTSSPRIVIYGPSLLSFLRKNEIHFDSIQ